MRRSVMNTLHFASDLAVSEAVVLTEQEAQAAQAKLQGLMDKHQCRTAAELAAKPEARRRRQTVPRLAEERTGRATRGGGW
jgi:hypothetical protein